MGNRQNLSQVYVDNVPRIRNSDIVNSRSRTYLRYLSHAATSFMEAITQALNNVFHRLNHSFKVNLSFLYVLQNCDTCECRFFCASNNLQLLRTPRLIRNQQDLNQLLDTLAAKDFPTLLKEKRPNSKWTIERIVSLHIHLVPTTYPLGKPPHLPDYIKDNANNFSLEKITNILGKDLRINYVFFIALLLVYLTLL